MNEPLQCPMCDSTRFLLSPYDGELAVHCLKCDWRGPKSPTGQGAINAWNARPAIARMALDFLTSAKADAAQIATLQAELEEAKRQIAGGAR